jgi:hypothetical protein
MLWYVSVRADRGREDMSVHAFCPRITQLRFIVVSIDGLVLLLPADNAKST